MQVRILPDSPMASEPQQFRNIEEEAKHVYDVREKARVDKLFLATEVLGYDFQSDVHDELFACYIPMDAAKQWSEQSPVKDRMVLWPRGHYKTYSIHVEIIQMIINFPDVRILIMQGNREATSKLLKTIKSHFNGENSDSKFGYFFPEFCATRLGTASEFTTPARRQKGLPQATVTIASPRTMKTGQHYDAGFFDDMVNDQNYRKDKSLQKIEEDFNMCLPLIDPGGYRYVTGTRYAHGDMYENIARQNTEGKWTITIKDCWSDSGKRVRFPQRTLPSGKIIGLTREYLMEIQRVTPAIFASQYLNKPASSASQIFTTTRMLGACVSEKDCPSLSQGVLFIDLAGSDDDDVARDDSVILCGKTDHLANIYCVDGIGGQWSVDALASKVIEMAMKHKPLRILYEATASSRFFIAYLGTVCRDVGVTLPLQPLKVDNNKGAKQLRIEALDGHLRTKRLRFFLGLSCWPKMIEQFVTFPKAKYGHDDYPDTVALMVQQFTGEMRPVKPLSEERHPLLKAMELQELENQSLFQHPEVRGEDDMGSEFDF